MTHAYTILDVFTDTPLEGNQLAVFIEAEAIADGVSLQRVARELNLSETVFLYPPDDGDADARVRIFTPAVEVPFAGHPTLGAACLVGERSGLDTVRLQTGAGVIPVTLTRDGGGRVTGGEMTQPVPRWRPFAPADDLLRALGLAESVLPVEIYDNGLHHVYVTVPDVTALEALLPDHGALQRLGAIGVNCCTPTGPRTARTRMFGAALGVLEDPATGSAAGPLAVHLVRHRIADFGETLTITQGVEIGRRSVLRARVEGAGETVTEVAVAGDAITVARGEYTLG